MEALKQEAIKVISKLSDTANIDDIMYELYVIDKVVNGKVKVYQFRELKSVPPTPMMVVL